MAAIALTVVNAELASVPSSVALFALLGCQQTVCELKKDTPSGKLYQRTSLFSEFWNSQSFQYCVRNSHIFRPQAVAHCRPRLQHILFICASLHRLRFMFCYLIQAFPTAEYCDRPFN